MSLSPTDVSLILANDVYPVMMSEYDRVPKVWQTICDVRPLDESRGMLFGWKESNMVGVGAPMDTPQGAEIPATSMRDGNTPQGKTRRWTRRLDIPFDVLTEANAVGKVGDMMTETFASFGEQVALKEEREIAKFFEKGNLTAGHEVFKGDFKGNADPYPLFIYDGLPFFDGAHTLLESSSTYANISTGGSTTQSNIESYIDTMTSTNAVDERGDEIVITPNVLLCPISEARTARRVLESPLQSDSANNAINTAFQELTVVPWRFLSAAGGTGGGYIGQAGKGLVVYDTGMIRTGMFVDEKREVISLKVVKHFLPYVKDWRYWYSYGNADS